MAKNNLAGLAALGALGMMMSKGKKTEVEDAQDVQNRYEMEDRSNAVSRGKTNLVDTGMSTPEPAENFSRRDAGMFEKEPDENYRNSGPRTSPTVKRKPMARQTPRTEINFESLNKPEVTPDSVKNLAGAFNVPMRPRQRLSEDGVPYKKGGVVKMAKGGMTSSASSRADGIAQKGKTRGKMC